MSQFSSIKNFIYFANENLQVLTFCFCFFQLDTLARTKKAETQK